MSFFSFSPTRDHMGGKLSKYISSESTQQIHSKKNHIYYIRCSCLKISCSLKTAGYRVKLSESWYSGALVQQIEGGFLECQFLRNITSILV